MAVPHFVHLLYIPQCAARYAAAHCGICNKWTKCGTAIQRRCQLRCRRWATRWMAVPHFVHLLHIPQCAMCELLADSTALLDSRSALWNMQQMDKGGTAIQRVAQRRHIGAGIGCWMAVPHFVHLLRIPQCAAAVRRAARHSRPAVRARPARLVRATALTAKERPAPRCDRSVPSRPARPVPAPARARLRQRFIERSIKEIVDQAAFAEAHFSFGRMHVDIHHLRGHFEK